MIENRSIELIEDATVDLSGSFLTLPKGTRGVEIKLGNSYIDYVFDLPGGFKIQPKSFVNGLKYRHVCPSD